MPDTDELQKALRAATQDLVEAPIRPSRVARIARLRYLLAGAGLLLSVGGLTVALVAGLLAGKSAVDPNYEPPFFSGAASEIDFGEPEVVRGHTPLRAYLLARRKSTAGVSRRDLAMEGLIFTGRLELLGHAHERLTPQWSLHPVGSQRHVQAPTYSNPSAFRPRSEKETRRISAWIGPPTRTGRYVVGFALHNVRGKVLAHSRSKPFVILGTDYFAPYSTPAFTARLPAEWHFEADYERTPDGRYVTRMTGPRDVSVLIDTTPGFTGDPEQSARYLHDGEKGLPGYHKIKLQPARLGPGKVFEWTFELGGRRKTDVFFVRGGDGYAVLAEGPPKRSSLIRSVAREVARSVRPKP